MPGLAFFFDKECAVMTDTVIHTPDARRLKTSPWGEIQHVTQIADDIWQVDTASHGGLKVSDQRLAAMPAHLRTTPYSQNGWFEEDCDWAFVAVCFPDAFKPEYVVVARQTMARCYPELSLPAHPAPAT